MFTRNIIVTPGCLSPRYQFQSSQRLNFLDLRPNKKLCLGFSVTAYSMNACDEYLHPCDLIRGSTMLCLPLMGILNFVWCMAVLMAWIADLEEQLLISGIQHLSCPVCTAVYHNLAETDGCGVHTGEVSISALKEVQRRFPLASLYKFKQQVKRLGKGLSGAIEEPCWAGLSIDPSVFIKQDILHGLHKFIWDHPGKCLKKLIGENEMDCHFIAQPPIHTQRFTGGISKISQASRQEHCAYQRLMLPIIFGHEKVNAKVINAIWSVLDFVYMAQYPLLSDSNLSKMKDLLSSFNRNKEVFISNGS